MERILTDNGNGYRSEVFRQSVDRGRETHKRTRPYRLGHQQQTERLNLTLEREWAYARPYCSNQQRRAALPAWLRDDNHLATMVQMDRKRCERHPPSNPPGPSEMPAWDMVTLHLGWLRPDE